MAAPLAGLSRASPCGSPLIKSMPCPLPSSPRTPEVLIDAESKNKKATYVSLHNNQNTCAKHSDLFSRSCFESEETYSVPFKASSSWRSSRGFETSIKPESGSHECIDTSTSKISPISNAMDRASVKRALPSRDTIHFKASATEMIRVFEYFDEDNDGVICAKDLRGYMTRIGLELSDREVDILLKVGDENGDGTIDLREFFSMYETLYDQDDTLPSPLSGNSMYDDDEEATMLAAFEVFDKNHDGVITAQELQTVLQDMGMAEGSSLQKCKKMIQVVDADSNGEIDFREFRTLMCSNSFHV